MTDLQHYRVTLPEAIAHYESGDLTAKGLLHFYLKIRLKEGWILKETQQEICNRLGISRASFYSALSKLKAEGSINWSAPANTKFSISLTVCEPEHESTILDDQSTILDSQSTIVDDQSTILDSQSTIVDEKSPKPSPQKDSGDSSDYSSDYFSNYLSTSPSDSEREKNLNFFNSLSPEEQKALIITGQKWHLPRLKDHPSLPERWIKCHSIEISSSDFFVFELRKIIGNPPAEEKGGEP